MRLWGIALLIKDDLYLLLDETRELAKAPFYNSDFKKYLSKLNETIEYLIGHYDKLPITANDFRSVVNLFWTATKYLKGSTSNQIPHETVYALRRVLEEWMGGSFLITTALLDEPNYHFLGVNPGHIIKDLISRAPAIKEIDIEVIQIALPRLYRHRPLNNVALYHELGHFVDSYFGIIKYYILQRKLAGQNLDEREINHLKELFADLFAASYTGDAIKCFLLSFAEGNPASLTHPATSNRVKYIDDFLSGKNVKLVDDFNRILDLRKLPLLEIKYTEPDIEEAFNDIKPYAIANNKELHGMNMIGRAFLKKAMQQTAEPWKSMPENKVSQIINDLVEKSVRNKMLKEKWGNASTTS